MAPPLSSPLHVLAALVYLLPFWLHATLVPRASLFPAPLALPPPPPELPTEVIHYILRMLGDCPETLLKLSLVCREFRAISRPIIFRTITITSPGRLVELAALLNARFNTIPFDIKHFGIHFDYPSLQGRKFEEHSSETVMYALTEIISLLQIQRTAFLSFPAVYSRFLDWGYLTFWTNLRTFSLHGHYGHVTEVMSLIAELPHLQSLVVSATFTTFTPNNLLLASAGPPAFYNFLSPKLREITIGSPGSLCLLPWMCSTGVGPEKLHLLRVRVDNTVQHSEYFAHILPFLRKYGQHLAHLYVWLDDTLDEEFQVAPERSLPLGEGLRHAPVLEQLELLLPDAFGETDIALYTDAICKHVHRSTSVRIRGGYALGIDEVEFWEAPVRCGQSRCGLGRGVLSR